MELSELDRERLNKFLKRLVDDATKVLKQITGERYAFVILAMPKPQSDSNRIQFRIIKSANCDIELMDKIVYIANQTQTSREELVS